MSRPIIEVPKEPIDWFLEGVAWIAIFSMFAYPLYHYGSLPEEIPTHFGPDGQPDAFGSKKSIWILPIISLITFIIFVVLNRSPHIFNYPTKITEDNALVQYQAATRLMRLLNAIITVFMAYITYGIVQTALENQNGLGTNAIWIFMTAVIGITIYYFWKNKQNK